MENISPFFSFFMKQSKFQEIQDEIFKKIVYFENFQS